MRQSLAAVAVAVMGVLVAGCGSTGHAESTTAPSTTKTLIPRPLVERELPGLLLSPEQVNAAMGTTDMAIISSQTSLSDHSNTMAPPECLALDGAGEADVYADSGYRAARDHSLNNGDNFTHYAKQAVVLFPLAETARAFFEASAEQWPACHEYRHTQSGTNWYVAELTRDGDILKAITVQRDAGHPGWGCGRALVLRNNIIGDVNTCSADPGDSAVRIAQQIGENVDAVW